MTFVLESSAFIIQIFFLLVNSFFKKLCENVKIWEVFWVFSSIACGFCVILSQLCHGSLRLDVKHSLQAG